MMKHLALIVTSIAFASLSAPLSQVACGQYSETQCQQLQQQLQQFQQAAQTYCPYASQYATYAQVCNTLQQGIAGITQQMQNGGCGGEDGGDGGDGDNNGCSLDYQDQVNQYIQQTAQTRDAQYYNAVVQFEQQYELWLERYYPQSCFYIQYCNPPQASCSTQWDCLYQGYIPRAEMLETILRDYHNNVYIYYIQIVASQPSSPYGHKVPGY